MYLQYRYSKNTVRKGETAHNEQFLLFPVLSTLLKTFLPFSSSFHQLQTLSVWKNLKIVIWERVKSQDCLVKLCLKSRNCYVNVLVLTVT